jgi:hypothetical protein
MEEGRHGYLEAGFGKINRSIDKLFDMKDETVGWWIFESHKYMSTQLLNSSEFDQIRSTAEKTADVMNVFSKVKTVTDSALDNVIMQFYYGEKLSSSAKTIHSIAAYLGAVSSADDIENKITAAVYPPLKHYVRRVLLVNVLCFVIFYGIFMSLTKIFFLTQIGN